MFKHKFSKWPNLRMSFWTQSKNHVKGCLANMQNAHLRQLTAEFFSRLWHNPDRRFTLLTLWLQSQPCHRCAHAIDALQHIVHTLLMTPGDVCATFTSDKGMVVGRRISLMPHDAFTLQWSWLLPSERRFFRWLASQHQHVFSSCVAHHDKGVCFSQYIHSDVVWTRTTRRLLLRDVLLLCHCQPAPLEHLSYCLLIAVMRECSHLYKHGTKDVDRWFLRQMCNTLQGIQSPPHEMVIHSPRKTNCNLSFTKR